MNSTTLKVPEQQTHTLENKMSGCNDCNSQSGSRGSLADSGSVSSYYTNDNSRSISRDSSFSSYSTSSTTGSSCCGCDIDSPLRRIIARGSSRKYCDRRNDQEDRPCSRLLNSRRKLFESSRDNGFKKSDRCTSNLYKAASLDGSGFRQTTNGSSRSKSEPEVLLSKSLLSSPQGLIIATPPAKRSSLTERSRVRSKSESYEDDDTSIQGEQKGTKESRKTKKNEKKRRETTAFDWCLDEYAMNRVFALLEGNKAKDVSSKPDEDVKKQLQILLQERDVALRERYETLLERDEVVRDRDRLKCERDALELERDRLREERDELKNELANRSSVIEHLKDHLGLAYIPFKIDSNSSPPRNLPKTVQHTNKLTVPENVKKIRPRSKSEVRPPEFFVPDEIFQRTSAYTRL